MARGGTVAGLVLALAASVGLNLYLWRRAPAEPSGEAASASAPEAASGPAPLDVPEGSRVVLGRLEEGSECTSALALCREEQAALERELASRRRPGEAFEAGEADPELEARVAPELDRLLEGHDYTLECRSGTCKLEVAHPDGATPNEWMDAVQSDPSFRKVASRWTFESARPTTDPVSGEGLTIFPMFFSARDPDAVPGLEILAALIEELESSGAIEDCARQHPDDRGTLHYRLRISAVERRIGADMGGDLYATEAGRCIAAAQLRIAAAAEVPEKVSGGVRYHHITLPLD